MRTAINDEMLEFMPAALEIERTPPNPLGRATLWTIVALFLLALTWACLGKVDIVAVAPGKLIPDGKVKVVQPPDTGVVERILVAEGRSVVKGQLLIELDRAVATANHQWARDRLLATRLDLAFTTAILADERPSGVQPMPMPVGTPAGKATLYRARLKQARNKHRATVVGFARDHERMQLEAQVVRKRIVALRASAPLLAEQVDNVASLVESGHAPRQQWLELERARIAQTAELETQLDTLTKAVAAVASVEQQRLRYLAERREGLLTRKAELSLEAQSLGHEYAKTETMLAQRSLTAPVSGAVHRLSVHSAGEVVTPAETLMYIVPDDATLVAETWLGNKDVGFVNDGDPVEIKIDAFPFTRYGTIDGNIMQVSSDALNDERLGLVFTSLVQLNAAAIQVGDRLVNLTPGMTVTVEVRTGQRRIVEYLLSPVLRALNESARER